jgi:hypothetical protein
MRQLSLATKRELIEAIGTRYQEAGRGEKKIILDEFVQVTGFHRKHAIRASKIGKPLPSGAPRSWVYDEAVISALTILWEAGDRICGKRLKQAIPILVDAMERHQHIQLHDEVRRRLFVMSPATMDRLLKPVRDVSRQGRRGSGISNTR